MMAKTGIAFGLLLCGLTVVSMLATTEKHISQFVPMMFGIPLLFLAVVSLNPHRRPRAVTFAGALAVLGVLAGVGRLFFVFVMYARGQQVNLLSIEILAAMTVTCVVFGVGVILWARRRQRRLTGSSSELPVVKSIANEQKVIEVASAETSQSPVGDHRVRARSTDGMNPYQVPPVIGLNDEPAKDALTEIASPTHSTRNSRDRLEATALPNGAPTKPHD